jgi:predicted nucleic acid-binding protein
MNHANVNPKSTPHIYVDTNILGSILEKQPTSSSHLLDLIINKGWDCSTSIFAFMELYDISQDNKYVLNQLQLGVHIKKAYKSLDQKNLSTTDLKEIQRNIREKLSEKYPNIKFYDLEKDSWDMALDLKISTNISAPDVIHLATAMGLKCDLLVTLDSFFKKEAERYIKTCSPEQVENTLRELGFSL